MAEPLTSAALLRPALDRRPFGLLFDVDGTISPLAPSPGEASVTPRNRALLERISKSVLAAAISGRDLADLRHMIGLPDIVYVGLHGLAWRIAGVDELAPEAQPYRDYTREAAAELGHLKRLDGVMMEVKTVGLALHYRAAPNPRTARAQIRRALASSTAAARFAVHEGIRLLELRPPIGITKGVAVRRIAARFNLEGLIFLGDDLTDVDGFLETNALSASGRINAYSIAVVHDESLDAVAAAADFTVAGVEGVEHLLEEIASLLPQ